MCYRLSEAQGEVGATLAPTVSCSSSIPELITLGYEFQCIYLSLLKWYELLEILLTILALCV